MAESKNGESVGVNRKEAESILKRFLDNKDYRVLAVNGKWGIGKTYLVQTFLNEHKGGYDLYASVFGISSIEQLKARLIANNQSSQGKTESVVNSTNKSIFNLFEWFNRISPKLEKTPKTGLQLSEKSSIPIAGSLISIAGDLALEILFNLNVQENSIICIDDLERKSQLPLEEILGFVEYLVQKRKCKIILIYNEDNLVETDKKVLNNYREKVIDREFKLDPTVRENLDIFVEEKLDIFKNTLNAEVIKNVFIRTGTNNIRVIRKTIWLIDEIISFMQDWEDSLRHQVLINSVVITVGKLDTDFCNRLSIYGVDIDTIVVSRVYNYQQLQQYQKKYPDEDQKTDLKKLEFQQRIEEMGYRHLEQLDELIINLVNTPLSYYTESEFREKGDILNQREKRNKILKKLDELENSIYGNSFADNEPDIINGIVNFLKENHLQLSIEEFDRIEQYTLILGLDIAEYEKPLLERIITEFFEHNFYEDLSKFRNKLIKYPDLESCLNDKI
ncbi:MAG: P-loop NTPase fold protein, partial [Trichormus sp.]